MTRQGLFELFLCFCVVAFLVCDGHRRKQKALITRDQARVLYYNAWNDGAAAMQRNAMPHTTWLADSVSFDAYLNTIYHAD